MKYPLLIASLLLATASAQAKTCRDNIPHSTPTSQFEIHNNGTVTHKTTGLMWQRCSLGQSWDGATCTGTASTHSWQNALDAAESNTFAGYADWRLPNIKELESLVESACHSPAINTAVFPDTPSRWFWSSSPYASYVYGAWHVLFDDGHVSGHLGKDYFSRVRLVRAGQ